MELLCRFTNGIYKIIAKETESLQIYNVRIYYVLKAINISFIT